MRDDDLDSYATTFKHLAKVTGYDLANLGTVHLFAMGLKAGLRNAILHWDTQPTTFDKWVNTAQNELQKFTRRQAFQHKDYMKYQWSTPKRTNGQSNGWHPNDTTVPMDVDSLVFTRVWHTYTKEDQNCYKKEGRCFYCDQQGHMARECPKKKQQSEQPNQPNHYKP